MMDATISLGWLVNIIILLLIAVAAYFLKRTWDLIDKLADTVAIHTTAIALLQQEQVVQNARLDTNEANIDRNFLADLTHRGKGEKQ